MNMKEVREALEKNPFEPMVYACVWSPTGNPILRAKTALDCYDPKDTFDRMMKQCVPLL